MNTRTDDHYPTRLDHAIPPIPRIEPGVWGSADQGPLDDEALQSYANGGYLIGRNLRHTAWFERRMEQRGREAKRFVETYGVLGLALGALTPLPFSICCQAAGALQMRYPRFALTILLRPPRVALYLWLVQVGFLQP